MITIVKNIECYSPKYQGVKDIYIAGGKILKIAEPDSIYLSEALAQVIDGSELLAFPGLIDGHVHISGGGGEDGFASRIGEINIKDILMAGITTVVGLLGADHITKSLISLLAKAQALESEGITTLIYSGSYSVPIITFSGDITKDMVLVDKVIGAGEIAISDHRSSHSSISELLSLASKVHLGGLLSGKAGLLHIHLGDGKDGLNLLNRIVNESELPIEMFLPTHVNRNSELFKQAIEYSKSGGNIDLTSGEQNGIDVPSAVDELIKSKINMKRVTISSDANGSIPDGKIGKIQSLYEDVIRCIKEKKIEPEYIFPLVTENPAKRLKLYPRKGTLQEDSDADILIVNKNYEIEKLFAMGKLVINNGRQI